MIFPKKVEFVIAPVLERVNWKNKYHRALYPELVDSYLLVVSNATILNGKKFIVFGGLTN